LRGCKSKDKRFHFRRRPLFNSRHHKIRPMPLARRPLPSFNQGGPKETGGATPGFPGLTMGGYLMAHAGSDPVHQSSSAPRVRPAVKLGHRIAVHNASHDRASHAEAKGVVDRWNEQLAAGREMLWPPTIVRR
jgi:hypothetical protein